MTTVSTTELRGHLSEVINRVSFGKERIQIRRQGKALVAVVPIEDLALIEELENRLDIIEAKKAEKSIAKHGTKPLHQLMRELGHEK